MGELCRPYFGQNHAKTQACPQLRRRDGIRAFPKARKKHIMAMRTERTAALCVDTAAQVIVAERGPLVWVFNFSPFNDYEGFKARSLG